MNFDSLDFGAGVLVGVMVLPLMYFIEIFGKIIVNAIRETSKNSSCYDCDQDCNQGRNCNDQTKENTQ